MARGVGVRGNKISWAMPVLALALLAPPPVAALEGGDQARTTAEHPSQRRGDAYAHLMRALFAIRDGEYGAAVEEIHGALSLQPESPDLLIESARLLTLMHRNSEAERLARRAVSLDATHEDALLFLADTAAERALRSPGNAESRDEAIRLYRRIVDHADEIDPEILRRLTQLEHESGNLPGAIDAARRLLKERPGDRRGAITLTELLLKSGQREEGLRELLGYIALHPFDEDLIRWSRDLVDRLSAWNLVDEMLAPHAPYSSEQLQINLLHAEALLRTGGGARAVGLLESLGEARPRDETVRRQLVFAYRGMRRMADAADTIGGLIEEFPNDPFYFVLLADTLSNQGDREGAVKAYEAAVDGLSGEPDRGADRDAFRQRIVLLLLSLERADQARAVLKQMEQPSGPLALEARARLALHEEDWSEARRAAKKLRSAGEGQSGFAAMIEGEAAVGERRWSEASKRFAEAARELGTVARPGIAEIYREGGRPQAGLEMLREWVRDQPEDAQARYQLGAYLYLLEEIEEAETQMREALRLDPQHAAALNFLGYSLAERKVQLDEALELVQRALEIDAWNGAFLDSLGWVYYQMGEYERAREPLERAARELPHDPTILEHLGDLYQALGEVSLALTAWDEAWERGPAEPESLRLKMDRQRQLLERQASDAERAESRPEPSPR
jgi:tetratricopeptide (TPR) repeat protein